MSADYQKFIDLHLADEYKFTVADISSRLDDIAPILDGIVDITPERQRVHDLYMRSFALCATVRDADERRALASTIFTTLFKSLNLGRESLLGWNDAIKFTVGIAAKSAWERFVDQISTEKIYIDGTPEYILKALFIQSMRDSIAGGVYYDDDAGAIAAIYDLILTNIKLAYLRLLSL